MYWRITISVFVFVLFASLTNGEDFFMDVKEKDSTRPIRINFKEDIFQKFYRCLCSRTTYSCEAVYNYNTYSVGYINENKGMTFQYNSTSKVYRCRASNTRSYGMLKCKSQYDQCINSYRSHLFHYKKTTQCDYSCIGLITFSNQDIPISSNEDFLSCRIPRCGIHTSVTNKVYVTNSTTKKYTEKPTAPTRSVTESTLKMSTNKITSPTSEKEQKTQQTTRESITNNQTESNRKEASSGIKTWIIVVIVVSITLLIVFITLGILLLKKRSQNQKSRQTVSESLNTQTASNNRSVNAAAYEDVDDTQEEDALPGWDGQVAVSYHYSTVIPRNSRVKSSNNNGVTDRDTTSPSSERGACSATDNTKNDSEAFLPKEQELDLDTMNIYSRLREKPQNNRSNGIYGVLLNPDENQS